MLVISPRFNVHKPTQQTQHLVFWAQWQVGSFRPLFLKPLEPLFGTPGVRARTVSGFTVAEVLREIEALEERSSAGADRWACSHMFSCFGPGDPSV